MKIPKIVVLISGSGSNLQALIDATKLKDGPNKLNGEITLVISSSNTAFGLTRAKNANIKTKTHLLKDYYKDIPKDDKINRNIARVKFDNDLSKIVLNEKPDLIICAGYMLILSLAFLDPIFKSKIPIINLHPALPGSFEGTHAIERSYKAGQDGLIEKGGCMIHYVIEEVDLGKPLIIKEIPVIKGETLENWETKIHQLEHKAIVEGAQLALKNAGFC